MNQNPFTLLLSAESVFVYENCIIVAVTAEQKVASVDRFNRLVVVCFCCDWIIGTPVLDERWASALSRRRTRVDQDSQPFVDSAHMLTELGTELLYALFHFCARKLPYSSYQHR